MEEELGGAIMNLRRRGGGGGGARFRAQIGGVFGWLGARIGGGELEKEVGRAVMSRRRWGARKGLGGK